MPDISLDTRPFEAWIGARNRELGTKPMTADIVAEGEAAKYAVVWDAGAQGKKPGKRTVRGKGGRIFSKQARQGYASRQIPRILRYLVESFTALFRAKKALPDRIELQGAVNAAAERGAELIRASAPQDTGRLKSSIRVHPGAG